MRGTDRSRWSVLDDGKVVLLALLALLSVLVAGLQLGAGYGLPAGLSLLAAVVFGGVATLRGRRLGG